MVNHPNSQSQAHPAAGEGYSLFERGLSIDHALRQSYYANRAAMIAGGYHVASGYAEAAAPNGADRVTYAKIIMAGHNYQRT
jgi:hypothetical protein